jgi:hypothetical protein
MLGGHLHRVVPPQQDVAAVTRIWPVVTVPVLSKTTVSTAWEDSSPG